MPWWIVPLLLLLAGILYLCYRALQYKPQALPPRGNPLPARVPEMPVAIKLSELIQIPTVSRRDPALEDGAAFQAFTEKLHALYPHVAANCHRLLVGNKGIVYCWRGHSDQRPSVLMSHYDVVPVQQEGWERDPFSGDVAGGYVHGRGAYDTKCTLAAAMEAADGLIADGFVPQQDVYLAFAGDEEVMGSGAPAILAALQEAGVTPGFVLDEGGGLSPEALPGVKLPCALVGIAEKGMVELTLTASSRAGHASAPPRHTALGQLARGIRRMERWPWPARFSPPVQAMVDSLGPHAPFRYRLIYANLKFLRPLISLVTGLAGGNVSATLRTTSAFTMAQGSDAFNVLPGKARATANLRVLPGETSRSVKRRAARLLREKCYELQVEPICEPSPVSRTDDAGWALLNEAIRETWPEALVAPYLMVACTDSRHYSRVSENVYRFSGIPCGKEDRGLMHAPNERISLSALAKCQAFYEALIVRL